MDQLLGCPTIKQMRRSLENIPTQLSGAYESSVDRIDAQSEALREIGHRLIGWVVHAERPLKPAEVTHAFAIEPEDDEIDQESIPMIQTLLRTCAGLVVLDRDRNTLVMVHISAYEFFYIRRDGNYRWHEDIARTSLSYLCLHSLQAGPCSNIDDINRRLKELPFLQYAARKWGKHASEPEIEEKLSPIIHRLLEDSNLIASSFQAFHCRDEIRDPALATTTLGTIPKEQKGLHIAAYWGLQRTTMELLARGEDSNCLDSQQWTPLHWAASEGRIAVMKLLLEEGAFVDSQDSQRWTPLFWSSLNGDIPALQFLLEKGANHLLRDAHGWTALHWAVSKGKENSVSALLEHHARYMVKDRELSIWSRPPNEFDEIVDSLKALNWQTPMEVAAEAGDASIFDTLLKSRHETGDNSLNDSWPSGHFDPPVSNLWRVMNKAERINGIESYMSGTWWSRSGRTEDQTWKATMLHSAIKDQKLPVVQLLIEIGADVNYNRTRSALHAAAFRKDQTFTQLLLQRGADVSLRDCHGQTALHQAVLNGFEETIACLLQGGSDVNARRNSSSSRSRLRGWNENSVDNQTPLMLAYGYIIKSINDREAQTRIVDLLLDYGADISLQDGNARTCLHYAAMTGSVDLVQKILILGTNVNVKDKEGIVAFHHAARSCDIGLVTLMVDRGADLRSIDNYGRSAIHHLAEGDESGFERKDLRRIFELIYSGKDPSMLNLEYDAVKARGGWTCSANLNRHTAISVAIEKKNWNLFQIFKESNAALPKDISGLLQHAIQALQPEALHFLFKHGAKLESLGSIHFAIRERASSVNARDLDLVLKDLINHGLDLNEHISWSGTILKGAATQASLKDVAQVLLENGADVYDMVDGFDSFLWAAIQGNLDFLDGLLTNAPRPGPGGHWTYNLEYPSATGYDDLESVCVALERSGQLESLGRKGHTILSAAVSAGNHHFVERLLAHGAHTEPSDDHGWRPLHYAVVGGHEAIVEYLLKASAEINAPTKTWVLDHAPRPSGLYKGNAWTGQALHLAAMVGNKEIAKILLDNGADVTANTGANTAPNKSLFPLHGPTALHIALGTGESYGIPVNNLGDGRLDIARMLIERGACVDGVADHLTLRNREKFKNYQDVWKKIGTGVSKAHA
jgi:ankyrin repeat protein